MAMVTYSYAIHCISVELYKLQNHHPQQPTVAVGDDFA